MKKTFLSLVGSIFLLVLVLAACSTSPSTRTVGSKHAGNMPGMNMGAATPTMPENMAGMDMESSTPMVMRSDPMTASLQPLRGKTFEITFMQEMIVHHQVAIQMAQFVATHTSRPQLKTLAQGIISDQSKEITDMTIWLNQWYGAKPLTDPMRVPVMMDMMGSMDQLKNAQNAAFDKQFLAMMIPHHQAAITMAHLLPTKTQRSELLTLGQNITKAQGSEIQQMQTWQKEWFPS